MLCAVLSVGIPAGHCLLAMLGLQVWGDCLCCSWGPGQLFHCPSHPAPAPLDLGGSAFPLLNKWGSHTLGCPFVSNPNKTSPPVNQR